jgi:hypothetical protein
MPLIQSRIKQEYLSRLCDTGWFSSETPNNAYRSTDSNVAIGESDLNLWPNRRNQLEFCPANSTGYLGIGSGIPRYLGFPAILLEAA